ncbi:MAG: DUF1684 domain-containing protein [Roseiflexaceae bacterium]
MSSYQQQIEEWRAAQEASLRSEDGWLALAGLFWLEEGQNWVGASDDDTVILPAGIAAGQVAVLIRQGQQVSIRPIDRAALMVNGEPLLAERSLAADMPGPADLVTIGSVTFFVIIRGERVGIRMRDAKHPAREAFTGREWYPIQPEARVVGRFLPDETPQQIAIPNILGDTEWQESPGVVEFAWGGQPVRLRPTQTKRGLFFIVRDTTSGHETYGIGRFLVTDLPNDGVVTLDLNQLYNPPCAFTPYATCPMAPRENHLTVAITAGERYHAKEGHAH